jgi:hypothetical protein
VLDYGLKAKKKKSKKAVVRCAPRLFLWALNFRASSADTASVCGLFDVQFGFAACLGPMRRGVQPGEQAGA